MLLPQLTDYLTLKFKHFFPSISRSRLALQYLTLCSGTTTNVTTVSFPDLLNRCTIFPNSLSLALPFSPSRRVAMLHSLYRRRLLFALTLCKIECRRWLMAHVLWRIADVGILASPDPVSAARTPEPSPQCPPNRLATLT